MVAKALVISSCGERQCSEPKLNIQEKKQQGKTVYLSVLIILKNKMETIK